MMDFKNIMAATTARYKSQEDTRKMRKWHRDRLGHGGDWRKVDDPERILYRMEQLAEEPVAPAVLGAPIMEDELPTANILERILKESNIVSAAFLVNGLKSARTVGRILIRSASGSVLGFGTGFLVSPRLLMTNHHVLENADSAGSSSVQFNYYETTPGNVSEPIEFRLEPDAFFLTDEPLDFTLVAVEGRDMSGVQGLNFGWNPLIRQSGKAIVGERVNIIQHPNGEPMRVVVHDNTIEDVFDDYLHYVADTQPGSSGSPVYNDQWEVAALHHSGVPKRDDQKHILLVGGALWDGSRDQIDQIEWVANEGIRISSIVDHIDRLQLGGTQKQYYDQVFTAPPELTLISDRPASIAPETGGVQSPLGSAVIEPDGSVSWYFRVNFGAAGPSVAPGTGTIVERPVPTTPTTQPPVSGGDDLTDKARGILDGADDSSSYYNAKQDAQDREAYYSDLLQQDLAPNEMYDSVHALLEGTHTTKLDYTKARLQHLYAYVDQHEDGKLRNIYSGTILEPLEVIRQELAAMSAFEDEILRLESLEATLDESEYRERLFTLENKMRFNCEHVVPQSWFDKLEPMKSDLHHLFTCEWNCNSFRNNIAYFAFDPMEEKLMSECGRVEHDDNQFEPENGRGVVARACLYFLVRYKGVFVEHENLMPADRLDTLKLWHKTSQVTRYELHRNACIFKVQGVRNPFIDFPELVERIDFSPGFDKVTG